MLIVVTGLAVCVALFVFSPKSTGLMGLRTKAYFLAY